MIAKATANVLEEFDLKPDPRTQAIIGLVMACGAVYAPRVVAYRMRKAQAKQEASPGVAGVYAADGRPQGTTSYKETPSNNETKKGQTTFKEFDPNDLPPDLH